MRRPLVTIGIPVYKRLDLLPMALESVAAQDYPDIELIVSDNGLNGDTVPQIVAKCYRRPYVFRQNKEIVNLPAHYNQLVEGATGAYFIWMPDDDLLSPNYVSELVPILECEPDVSAVVARNEYIDMAGRTLRSSPKQAEDRITGEQLLERWTSLGYESFTAILARTAEIRACGGYPDFPGGTHCDDALLVKLALGRTIAFTDRCTYRLRIDESSAGWSMKCHSLAEDTRRYLAFLDSDPTIKAYGQRRPDRWSALRKSQVRMTWQTYYFRWAMLYRQRLAPLEWAKAGFALPFLPEYYRLVFRAVWQECKSTVLGRIKGMFSWALKTF